MTRCPGGAQPRAPCGACRVTGGARCPAHAQRGRQTGGTGSRRCRPLSSPQRRGAAALLLPAQRYWDGERRTHGVPVTGEGGLRSGVLRTGSTLALGGLPETDIPGTLRPHPAR